MECPIIGHLSGAKTLSGCCALFHSDKKNSNNEDVYNIHCRIVNKNKHLERKSRKNPIRVGLFETF